jgi:hypothetical protein
MSSVRTTRRLILLGVLLYLAAWGYRIYSRLYYVWMPGYVSWMFHSEKPAAEPVHVFFVFVDHFEPGNDYAIVERWRNEYPNVAGHHRDSTGRPVQHTWFYPGEQPADRTMTAIRELVTGGYGEAELHLHHADDTQESTRRRFQEAIAYFQKFGFLKTADGATHFAFIHGNWGLDNSEGKQFCGDDRELAMLRELGCFADYTFPASQHLAQPPFVNNIYEATDDDRPKSYDHGVPLQEGVKPEGDLLIFQGPMLFVPAWDPRKLFFVLEDSNIHDAVPVTPGRVDAWMRARIHVQGRPDWQFIKIHTHGAREGASEVLGPHFDTALSYLERAYNDGTHYVLHYVTAREAFNLARAAADGKRGDPRQYYDYLIPPYLADGRRDKLPIP